MHSETPIKGFASCFQTACAPGSITDSFQTSAGCFELEPLLDSKRLGPLVVGGVVVALLSIPHTTTHKARNRNSCEGGPNVTKTPTVYSVANPVAVPAELSQCSGLVVTLPARRKIALAEMLGW